MPPCRTGEDHPAVVSPASAWNSRGIGALALFCALVAGVAACGSPPTATSLVAQGLRAQISGNVSTAEDEYQQAIKLDENNVIAHYDLGTVYDKQGNTTQASAEYRAALVVDPTFSDALFNLAVDTAGSDPAGAALHSPRRREGRGGTSGLGTGSCPRPVAGVACPQRRAVCSGSRIGQALTNPEAISACDRSASATPSCATSTVS